MDIKRAGAQPSAKGPSDWFTGTVRIDALFQPTGPARAAAASVTFEPGARTAWHTHPLGQTPIVTAGCGWVQREPARRRRVVSAGRETLAWRLADDSDDAHCNSGRVGRQVRPLDGEGRRRAIQALMRARLGVNERAGRNAVARATYNVGLRESSRFDCNIGVGMPAGSIGAACFAAAACRSAQSGRQ
jgi:hypothetical protein